MANDDSFKVNESWKSFGGSLQQVSHTSAELGGLSAVFSIYLPPQYDATGASRLPVLFFLSGLTCTDQNFCQKSGAMEHAARLGIVFVAPDTSPRGAAVPGEDDGWDFGTGAGFYVDATQPAWAKHYRMYSYVSSELPALVARHFPGADVGRAAISGHSMGGHGALVLALRNPGRYRSVSAFAPIVNPTQVPWGVKAFSGYLGEERGSWAQYDATELVGSAEGAGQTPILIDQGTADKFLAVQLKPQNFLDAASAKGITVHYREREGYDHSYFYIATFIAEHFDFHASYLK